MSKNQSDNAKEIKLNADYKQWLAELKQDLEGMDYYIILFDRDKCNIDATKTI